MRKTITRLQAEITGLRTEVARLRQSAQSAPAGGLALSADQVRALLAHCHPDRWQHAAANEITRRLIALRQGNKRD